MKGTYYICRHPIQTGQGVITSIAHPIQTYNAITEDLSEKSGTLRGQGSIAGGVLIGVATAGTVGIAAKTGTVAKVVRKLKRTPDVPEVSPRNAFPAEPSDLTKRLGVQPSKVSTTQHGTRRVVWEPNKNTRIRHESHPGDSGPFNPRHHGEHYHVEIKPDNLSWNQAKRQRRVTKVRPEDYQPRHGTGFVPGENFPGSN